MSFNKNLKLILSLLYMVMIAVNIIMYFFTVDNVTIFGKDINMLYIQVAFLIAEGLFLSGIYGKKQGLLVCLLFVILVAINIFFIMSNLV